MDYLPPPLPLVGSALRLSNPLNLALALVLVLVLVRLAFPAPPFAPPPYGLASSPARGDYNWRPSHHPPASVWRTYSPQQLRSYDGVQPGSTILFAIRRKVYDVTAGASFYGPGGPYAVFAGRDASRGLAKQSFEPEMLTPVDEPIDSLDDLTQTEWDNLRDWEGHFNTKYTQCGDYVQD
ncbi:hypothetical protein JCM3770_005993 [Rhodotorula araucariae]